MEWHWGAQRSKMTLRMDNVDLSFTAIPVPPPLGSSRERQGAKCGLFLIWMLFVLLEPYFESFEYSFDSTQSGNIRKYNINQNISSKRGFLSLLSEAGLRGWWNSPCPFTAHPIISVALPAQGSGALRQPSKYKIYSFGFQSKVIERVGTFPFSSLWTCFL